MKSLILAIAALLAALSPLAAVPALAQPSALSQQEEARVRALVRDTLIANPEILEEALQALQAKRAKELQSKIESDQRHYAIGPRNASLTIVEFFDYRCGYCKAAADWVFNLSRTRRDVRIIFKEYPVLGPDSIEASKAAIASIRQGGDRYVRFHRAMMDHRGALDAATIDRLARGAGVDTRRMRRDMADPAVERLIADNHDVAAQAGVQGTPAFMINGAFVYGFDRAALEQLVRDNGKAKRS